MQRGTGGSARGRGGRLCRARGGVGDGRVEVVVEVEVRAGGCGGAGARVRVVELVQGVLDDLDGRGEVLAHDVHVEV